MLIQTFTHSWTIQVPPNTLTPLTATPPTCICHCQSDFNSIYLFFPHDIILQLLFICIHIFTLFISSTCPSFTMKSLKNTLYTLPQYRSASDTTSQFLFLYQYFHSAFIFFLGYSHWYRILSCHFFSVLLIYHSLTASFHCHC